MLGSTLLCLVVVEGVVRLLVEDGSMKSPRPPSLDGRFWDPDSLIGHRLALRGKLDRRKQGREHPEELTRSQSAQAGSRSGRDLEGPIRAFGQLLPPGSGGEFLDLGVGPPGGPAGSAPDRPTESQTCTVSASVVTELSRPRAVDQCFFNGFRPG